MMDHLNSTLTYHDGFVLYYDNSQDQQQKAKKENNLQFSIDMALLIP